MKPDKRTIFEAVVGGIVAGAALAAGAELWAFISPSRRRALREDKLKALMSRHEEQEDE